MLSQFSINQDLKNSVWAQKKPKIWLFILLFTVIATGCGRNITTTMTTPPLQTNVPKAKQATKLPPKEQIIQLLKTAQNYPPNQAFTLKRQAWLLSLEHESLDQAKQRLALIDQQYPQTHYQTDIQILKLKLLLAQNKPRQVLKLLNTIQPSQSYRQERLQLKIQALEQLDLIIDSIKARIKLGLLLDQSGDARIQNDKHLWHQLNRLSSKQIGHYISQFPDTLSGWLELAYLNRKNQKNPKQFKQAITQWQARHLQHPANHYIVTHITQQQIATSRHPKQIALLLPLSGQLANIGKVIRDGFITQYLQATQSLALGLTINIYDTHSHPEQAMAAFKQAQKDKAQFIIGPLNKQAVMAVINEITSQNPVSSNTTHPSILVLNQIDFDHQHKRVYQFALDPESEAIQVAQRAHIDGYRYAMVMTPKNNWGNRLNAAFSKRYQELGGTIVYQHQYQRNTTDYAKAIEQGLSLHRSKSRHRQLENLLGMKIQFTPRTRQDLDMIFMAAFADDARQIKPQLRFFYPDSIPVYATSHIFTGQVDSKRDKELNGITFPDMPWVFSKKSSRRHIIKQFWGGKADRYFRFYAFGGDIFLLLPQLQWLEQHPNQFIQGDTGQLSVNGKGQVSRRLSWAKFTNGLPQAIGSEPDNGIQ